jgi:hypothetical protein
MISDPDMCYLDGNSLGRLPLATVTAVNDFMTREWGPEVVTGWGHWVDEAQPTGDLLGRATLGAAAGQVLVCDTTSVNFYQLALAAIHARPGRKTIIIDAANFPTDRYILEGIAKQFGTQTNAQKARIAAVERAGGQEIGQEAQAKSAEFVQSEAGKQMLKDIGTVKAGGGNAVEALRNQLSSAIVAGAIGTEEARAIAAEVGTALGDQSIAVGVSGELTKLMGPNGEDMLKNLSSITAEISPKINVTKLAADATSAYEKMNVGAKFIQAFQGGEEQFIKNFKINEVSATTSAAFAKEAEARELLNLAYQEGTISLEEYLKQSSAIAKSSKENQNTAAQSLGFSDQAALATAAEGKAFTPGAKIGRAHV